MTISIEEILKDCYLDRLRDVPAESARTATAAAAVKAAMAEGVFVDGALGDAEAQNPIPSEEERSQPQPAFGTGATCDDWKQNFI